MNAQSYSQPVARERMSRRLCPECGGSPQTHGTDNRFWLILPGACDLLQRGVLDRIAQYDSEVGAV